jgi:hypothetical protein
MCSERVSMAGRHFAGCEAEGRCGAAGANAFEKPSAGRVTPFDVNGGAAKRSLGCMLRMPDRDEQTELGW